MLDWLSSYDKKTFVSDALAAVIVTIMLIPQSLAYASLAGLPPEVGLYASIAPLVAYGLLGSSRVLAVGPVAVISLMTASALGDMADQGSAQYLALTLSLAMLSGIILTVMGFLKLGWIANFLSHPVISGFITASAVLIAAGQLLVLAGLKGSSQSLVEVLHSVFSSEQSINWRSLVLGTLALICLVWIRKHMKSSLVQALKISPKLADQLSKAGPIAVIALSALFTWLSDWHRFGVAIVGVVPRGLPPLSIPVIDFEIVKQLFVPAFFISLVGFVESVSVGQTLAARQRQVIKPNQELLALGASNIASALTGGFPVTGGFARSVVNYDAGAQTPAAGVYTALGLLLAVLFLTPLLHYVPKTTLAATIIVAVLSLADWNLFRRAWTYSKSDFLAAAATLVGTLAMGVEVGLALGVGLSIMLFMAHTTRPHIAEIGLIAGTEHFRNRLRHEVKLDETVISLRLDESLYFANARSLEHRIQAISAQRPAMQHLVLLCSAVNEIDMSGMESLESIHQRLTDAGVQLHLSEVKGPVMDRLRRSEFFSHFKGQVFLSHFQAIEALAPHLPRA